MFTSYHGCPRIDPDLHAPIRISVGHARWKRHYKDVGQIKELAPPRSLLGLEKSDYEPRYLAQLNDLNPGDIRAKIAELAGGKIPVLLCFEKLIDKSEWCHRRMFARWWENETGEKVREL